MNTPFGMQRGGEGGFKQSLYYFMKEFGFNPLDQEYVVKDNKGNVNFIIIKKGIGIPLFNAMMKEMELHHKKKATASRKGK